MASQTIASFEKSGLRMGGLCSNGHEVRSIEVDNQALIERFGPEALVCELVEKITCRECGGKVRVTVSSATAVRLA